MKRIIGVAKPLLVVTLLAGVLSACHGHHGGYGYRDGGYYGQRGGYGYSGGYARSYDRGYRGGYYR